MFYLGVNPQRQRCSCVKEWKIVVVLLLVISVALFCGCQKSEAPPAASAPQKAAAPAPQKDAAGNDPNELNYDKAMAKQYAEGAPVNFTGKVMQIPDEKTITVATRKDDVFGYLDNIVMIAFQEKHNFNVGDIVQFKTKSAGIKKYKTEGKGEYDAPFLKAETFEVLEKGKPAK